MRVGSIMSRFPKLSETFILYEILELRHQELQVELFPIIHHREPMIQPGVESLIGSVAEVSDSDTVSLDLDNPHLMTVKIATPDYAGDEILNKLCRWELLTNPN